ncbi:Fic/DOC family protein [Candidatus Arcanobacter lacustris]|uniref:Fic/DOC family protein n=1 Tax=Candidatus Arcanibacter lacustris TaxID=1607817 RepID=A0A0F5MNU0_9RICK|nr:Fic/DOC family protein [Candidatus Arcanobacter lacustris]
MIDYKPPFTLTSKIINLSEAIAYEMGRLAGEKMLLPTIKLRRSNRIKTIQASLAIEGNTLTLDQITDILDGKHILGPSKDILEVKNALELYANLRTLSPLSIEGILKAHDILMKNLIEDHGKFRTTSVGIFKGSQVTHIAPQAKRVQILIQELLEFLKKDQELSWLIKSCIFHYEFEFIHPFADGNGRMGRLWQQILLMKYSPLFEYIAVEELIKENQEEYYITLGKSDKSGESTIFIEFMLKLILESLNKYGKHINIKPQDAIARLEYAKESFKKVKFSRRDYMTIHRDISGATASRDLLHGIERNIIKKTGSNNQTTYMFM